jgi:CHAT domain-containing protein
VAPGSCVSDYVVSSYTPTVTALLNKLKGSLTTKQNPISMLLISQPSTPGQIRIPGAREESHAIQNKMEAAAVRTLLLEGASAIIAQVKTEMNSHSWVHFACHAIQDIKEPLKSGVQLHDNRLELLELMKQQLPNADFAFLSACQTSTGDEKLSEEAVHLAAGMLAAGYQSVVATMWSIKDEYGPVVAKDFYAYIVDENVENRQLDSANAAHALHYAIQNIRKNVGDTEEALLTWVPYVHFGI